MNRRTQIQMTPPEQRAFLEGARTVILCTNGRGGYPHAVAMWFCVIDGQVHMSTFRKAQKVVNLRRDPRATLLVESGDTYTELRGLMLRCDVEVVDDPDAVFDTLVRVQRKHGLDTDDDSVREALRAQAAKRCVLRFHPVHVSSWDHSKLGGAY